MTNDHLLSRFAVEHFERNSISKDRRALTVLTLRRIAEQIGGRTLDQMTPSDLMEWQGAELKRGIKPNTLRNRETMVRAFIGWAHIAGVIGFEQFAQLKSVPPPRGVRSMPQPKPYKRAEIEALRQKIAERYPLMPSEGRGSQMLKRYLQGKSRFSLVVKNHAQRLQIEAQVALALELGLRMREIYDLTPDRMHPDNVAVVVRTIKQAPGLIREREVPWTEHARMCVSEWLDFRRVLGPAHDQPWLALKWGKEVVDPEPFVMHEFMLLRIGFAWHRLRHTFATERLRAGMPLEKVQVMLGHATLQQTLAYAEIVNADVLTEAQRSEAKFQQALGLGIEVAA